MQYNTALALVRSYSRVAVGLATFVLILGFLTLLEYLLGADFGIDQVLMESYVLVGTSSPGRMAPNTALCFMILGAAVILSEGLFADYKSWVSGVAGDALQFRYVNLAAMKNTGYSREELLNFTPLDLVPSLTRQSLEELLLPLVEKRQETVSLETRHRRKDGATYEVEVNLQLTTYRSAPAFVAIIMDVSERTRAEKALRETIERLSVREKISHIFSTVSDDEMYGDVLQVVQEQLQSPQGVFGYLDEKGALVVPSMTRAIWDECRYLIKEPHSSAIPGVTVPGLLQ